MSNKKAAVSIDTYKAPVFRENLKKAGFVWTEHAGLVPNAVLLKVEYTDATFNDLYRVLNLSNSLATRVN